MGCIEDKAEIDAFLELSCFFHDPVDVGNLISGSSAFSKTDAVGIPNFCPTHVSHSLADLSREEILLKGCWVTLRISNYGLEAT